MLIEPPRNWPRSLMPKEGGASVRNRQPQPCWRVFLRNRCPSLFNNRMPSSNIFVVYLYTQPGVEVGGKYGSRKRRNYRTGRAGQPHRRSLEISAQKLG